jgi:beta-1,4-N-acetylglucosaminyltransferase
MKIGLIGSSGGHLTHLHWMAPWWRGHDRFWVTFPTPDAQARLAGERVYWAHHPTNRNLANLGRNLLLARQVLRDERPDLLVSTGAGVALPFLGLGGALGIPCVFVEVYDRIDRPSWTGRLLNGWVDAVVLQWEAQRAFYPDGVLFGPIR